MWSRKQTPEVPQTPQPSVLDQRAKKERKVSKPKVSVTRSPKKSFSRQESLAVAEQEDEDVYTGLDASHSLIIHGNVDMQTLQYDNMT